MVDKVVVGSDDQTRDDGMTIFHREKNDHFHLVFGATTPQVTLNNSLKINMSP